MRDFVAALRHKWTKRSAPARQRMWDQQYASGFGDLLSRREEQQRYATLVDFMVSAEKNQAILDVGCGEGILLDFLEPFGYQQYLGFDFSAVAIQNASKRANARATFVRGSAESFVPDGRFDCIVFNECLYYLPDPMPVLRRFVPYLARDGVIIVSMLMKTDSVKRLASEVCRTYAVDRSASSTYPDGTPVRTMLARPRVAL